MNKPNKLNKRGMEMTISTIVVLVIALVLLAVSLYLIYTKILKPAQGADSVLACEGQGKRSVESCSGCNPGDFCTKMPNDKGELKPCCISEVK